ncbi:hypothetical protein QVD17_40836 [Tagetes erecta]|uniref:C3H1-type domain-containing protein n=1 Tax=Tagetes erecta TaxID=13708 RepID=A0AAD8JQC2_TARER|nr:hypothetical protein QVD17_40836 [Tagetes erecta]
MYHHQQHTESPGVYTEETLFKKFLPYNSGVDSDEENDPYTADHFRMYEFKVRKCTRSRSHDWTDCPFAHPGEKARRRCPRRYNYSGTVCPEFRRGSCSRGDLCEFAHGVFECWLHPSRYRTEACKDGKKCQRKICFFAHTQRQLRVVPAEVPMNKFSNDSSSQCCGHCRCNNINVVRPKISPTSTLNLDLDSLSPPFSPAGSGFSPVSRYGDRLGNSSFCDREVMNEVMRSLEAMVVEENRVANIKSLWIEACLNGNNGVGVGGDEGVEIDSRKNIYNESCVNGPDLGWVNDLLT